MVRIGSNISSLNAQRRLADSTNLLSSVFERLSSGQRINKASDDAAGLAIAESLKKDVRVYTQAIRNVNDGVSALNIAQGALSELSSITIRQKELATQAANGIYTVKQRQSMNKEVNALVDEYNRIIQSAEFNGIKLTDNSLAELRVQAGYGLDGSIGFDIGAELARTVGDGSFKSPVSYVTSGGPSFGALGDLNGDGIIDLATAELVGGIGVFLGTGNGTFGPRTSYAVGSLHSISFGDVNEDGILDIVYTDQTVFSAGVLIGRGNGGFNAAITFATGNAPEASVLGDLNGDGHLDLAVAELTSHSVGLFFGNGDGTFKERVSLATGLHPWSLAVGDLNGDSILDLVTADSTVNKASVFIGNGDGTFKGRISYSTGSGPYSIDLGDLNGDGILDMVTGNGGDGTISIFAGKGNGTFYNATSVSTGPQPRGTTIADVNGDGLLDIMSTNWTGSSTVSILLGNGNGTFQARISTATGSSPRSLCHGDLNADGALDIVTLDHGDGKVGVLLANAQEVSTTPYLNINTRQGALDALDTLENTLQRISRELGIIGSIQSRFEVTLKTLAVSSENFSAASGRIMDADIAQESAVLISTQLLQQAGAAVLGQANQQPALAVQLLRI